MNKKIILTIGSTAIIFNTVACSSYGSHQLFNAEAGQVMLAGDEKGVQALMDGLTGMSVVSKADPHKDNPYHELRRAQDATRRLRFMVVKPKTKKDMH